jgi:ABC-type dipeptide/oligopeptide/nickel transport system permease component
MVIAGVMLVVSLMIHVAPGDPVMLLVGDAPMDQEQLAQMRRTLGLDKPLPVQLGRDILRFARGDLGHSLRTNRLVSEDLRRVVPATVTLALAAMVLGIAIGAPAGLVAAIRRGQWLDSFATAFAVVGFSMPTFWTGLLFIWIFAVRLGWFPTSGEGSLRALILPAVTLGWYAAGGFARMMRSGMLEVLRQDYVVAARAKGLAPRIIVLKHALLNALIPIVTLGSIQFGALLSGAVVVETVFARDGLGRLIVSGILQKDFPVVQGAVLVIAVIYTVTNLVTDLLYLRLDPRLRYA